MLWTDRIFITTNDLVRVDSEVLEVSSAEGITLVGSNGLVRGAVEEAAQELQKILTSFGGCLGSGDVSLNHLAAVLSTGLSGAVYQKVLLAQVVVSGDVEGSWNSVKHWAVFWSLMVLYRDAFNRTVKDRYEGKMRYYKSEIQRRVTPSLIGTGLPIVLRPLSAPGAVFDPNIAGEWSQDNLSLVSGSGTVAATYDVAITWVDKSEANLYVDADNVNNAESNPSERASLALVSGKVLKVDASSLNPPTGKQHPSQASSHVLSLMKATHWNVYAGEAGGTLYLQNSSPIPVAQTTYTLSGNPTLSGHRAGLGQYPDRRLSIAPTRKRA